MSEQNIGVPGGWSEFSCELSKTALKIFEETKPIGVRYSPVAVATQVVAGTNYAFFCNANRPVGSPYNNAAIIYIHAPLPGEGEPSIVRIEPIEISLYPSPQVNQDKGDVHVHIHR